MAMLDKNENDMNSRSNLSRRQVLALSSGALVTGVAGCLGGNSNNTTQQGSTTTSARQSGTTASTGIFDTSTSTEQDSTATSTQKGLLSGKNIKEKTLDGYVTTQIDPTKKNINPWNPNTPNPGGLTSSTGLFQSELALRRAVNGAVINHIIKDVTLADDGCSRTITFKKKFSWWDGTQVTIDDWLAQSEMNDWITYGGPSKSPNELKKQGEFTVKEVLESPTNEYLGTFIPDTLYTKRTYAQKWLKQYRNASGQNEIDSITQKLGNTKLTLSDIREQALGNGLWIPEQINVTGVLFKKNENHPFATQTNIPLVRLSVVPDSQKLSKGIQQDQYDYLSGGGGPPDSGPGARSLNVINTLTAGGGRKLTFNFNNPHMGNRAVRHAIGYLLPFKQMLKVAASATGSGSTAGAGANGVPVRYQTGMAGHFAKQWLGEDWMKQNLIDYGVTSKKDKARQVLQDAGYEKNNGVWEGPDGPINGISLKGASNNPVKSIIVTASSQLSDFGIKNEKFLLKSSRLNKVWNDSYDYDIFENWFYNRYPQSAYQTFQGHGLLGIDQYADVVEPPKTEQCTKKVPTPTLKKKTAPRTGQPIRPKYPAPGNKEINVPDDAETLYPIKSIIEMGFASEDWLQELSRQLAWYYNWQLPHVQTYAERWTMTGDTSNFKWPDKSSDLAKIDRLFQWVKSGRVSAKLK